MAWLMKWIITLLLLPIMAVAQVILSEVMFDPDTLESHNEFLELYNSGSEPANLAGWTVGDTSDSDLLLETGKGYELLPGRFAVILDQSYFGNSTIYDSLIPDSALVLSIDDGSFGNYGWSNTNPEDVIVINSAGDTVQRYLYSLPNDPGYSDEKIKLNPDNGVQNWGNSLQFRGTPGYFNTISKHQRDISLDSLWLDPVFPAAQIPFQLIALVKNIGSENIDQFLAKVFRDANENGLPEDDEVLDSLQITNNLAAEDTLHLYFTIPGVETGKHLFGIFLDLTGDQNQTNNLALINVQVENEGKPLVINEIMFSPRPGSAEWVEFYNISNSPISLLDWFFADSRDTVRIREPAGSIVPGGYYIIAGDSSFLQETNLNPAQVSIISNLPTLNNDEDDLKLLNPSGRLIDRVLYASEWMRRDTDPGISL
ncbi:MAG: lamin tail domain-containing protein, partial [Calditrichia bacterium]